MQQQKATLRPELDAAGMPHRMKFLPVDRGYPVPWFVDWIDGAPEFRAMNPNKWVAAVKKKLCWVCGSKLGKYMAFVSGPMCGINRTSSEPPCHLDCARWSAKNCPFLVRPRMVRREGDGMEDGKFAGGIGLTRNPGQATTVCKHCEDSGWCGVPEERCPYCGGKKQTTRVPAGA
jgi:hypothetical protein